MSFYLLLFLSATSSMLALDTTDHEVINQTIEHFSNAWNYHGGQGSADYYAEDADFINIFGMAFAGKQEIETRHIKIHETFLKGSTFEVIDVKLREASPEVVIAHVYWKVSNVQKPRKDLVNESMKGVFTHVFLKNHEKWEIIATQNTPISN